MYRKFLPGLWLCLLLALNGCGPSIEDRQKRSDAQYQIGIAALSEGNLPEAFQALEKAREYHPNDAKIHHALGIIYLQRQQYDEALTSFRKSLQLDPAYSEAHNNIGKVYFILGDYDKAIAKYKEALANPLYRTPELARYNLGEAYLEKGDNINAMKEFLALTELYPNFSQALNKYGIALYRMNRNQEAIKRFQQAIEYAPEFIEPHLNLGIVHMKLGNTADAVTHFQFVRDHSNNDAQAADAERYLDMLE